MPFCAAIQHGFGGDDLLAQAGWRCLDIHDDPVIGVNQVIGLVAEAPGPVLYAVYFYVRFPVSYRDLEEIMVERGVVVDHATLNRWVEKYAGAVADGVHHRKVSTGQSWRMPSRAIAMQCLAG